VKSLRFETDHDSTTCTSSLSFGQQQASSLSFGQQQAAYHPVSTAIPLETHRHAYVYDTLNTARVVNNCSYVNPPIFETDDFYSLILPTSSSFNLTSTPTRIAKGSIATRESGSSVKLSVDYPSKTVNKTLKNEYETLGKALAHGPPQRIAKAVLKCKPLTKFVIENVLRLITTEVYGLCSRKNPSLLRKTGKEAIVNFNFESLCDEWKERAPIFYSFLMTVGVSKVTKDAKWLPSVALAGSVLLKQRNSQMNATAATLGIMLKTGSMQVINMFSSFYNNCRVIESIVTKTSF
jgi:hypothetical protein